MKNKQTIKEWTQEDWDKAWERYSKLTDNDIKRMLKDDDNETK